MPTQSTLQRFIRRQRTVAGPAQPNNLFDFKVPAQYQITNDGDAFLLHDTGPGNDRILIFGTQRNLQLLSQHRNWYGDGTFKVVPEIFYQLYTLHIFIDNH